MIITVVTFPAESPAEPAELRALLERTAPTYRDIPGLRRKYFIGDGASGGGIYEWTDQAHADAWFDEAWFDRMHQTYGVTPSVVHYRLSCLVDNVTEEIKYAV